MVKFSHAEKILLKEKTGQHKKINTINDNYRISIIDIKFYIVYCLFMVVFVEAKIKYN